MVTNKVTPARTKHFPKATETDPKKAQMLELVLKVRMYLRMLRDLNVHNKRTDGPANKIFEKKRVNESVNTAWKQKNNNNKKKKRLKDL